MSFKFILTIIKLSIFIAKNHYTLKLFFQTPASCQYKFSRVNCPGLIFQSQLSGVNFPELIVQGLIFQSQLSGVNFPESIVRG